MSCEPNLTWPLLAAFIRQHTHDVRNHLSSLDLESALLTELVPPGEAMESVGRIRQQIRGLAAELRALSARFAEPVVRPSPLRASELMAIWKDQADGLSVEWDDRFQGEEVSVDASAIAPAFEEFLKNARIFSPKATLRATGYTENKSAIFRLHEPKSEPVDPALWGLTPFLTTRHKGLGLGLFGAHRVVTAHGGKLAWKYVPEPSELQTQLELPLA